MYNVPIEGITFVQHSTGADISFLDYLLGLLTSECPEFCWRWDCLNAKDLCNPKSVCAHDLQNSVGFRFKSLPGGCSILPSMFGARLAPLAPAATRTLGK